MRQRLARAFDEKHAVEQAAPNLYFRLCHFCADLVWTGSHLQFWFLQRLRKVEAHAPLQAA